MFQKKLTRLLPLACVALLMPGFVQAQGSNGKLAIKVGRIITQAAEGVAEIENGVILISNRRIQAIGTEDEVQIPWDAIVIEKPDHVAFPGFVEAHSSRGMDRANENVDVTPFLDVRDSIDPVNFYFEDSLRWGVTTINVQQGNNCVIGAQGMIVRPIGMTVEEMLVRPNSGLKLSAAPKSGKSRATQAQALRKAFADLRAHLEKLVQEKRDGDDRARREALYQGRDLEGENGKGKAMRGSAWKVKSLELIPRGEIDEKQEALLDLVEGKLKAYIACNSPIEVHTAIEVARDNGFLDKTTLVLSSSCWKAADVIKDAGVPVVLSSTLVNVEYDPLSGDEIRTFVPAVFQEKGIPYALSSSNQSTRSLWFQASAAVGQGLSRTDALNAVTRTPAEMLGLSKQVGSLEVGKNANVLLFSGDPLSSHSLIDHVVIEGDMAYDRSKDVRAQYLMDGERPAGSAPEEGHEEGDEDDSEDAAGDDDEDEETK